MTSGAGHMAAMAEPVAGPWELPDGWWWSRLGDLSTYVSRGRGPKYVESGGVRVVNQRCVRWDGVDFEHCKRTDVEAAARLPAEQSLQDGDILWNSTGTGTIGRAAVFRSPGDERFLADSHVTIVRLSDVNPCWVHHWISTHAVQQTVAGIGSTNQVELGRQTVFDLPVPCTHAEVQRRVLKRMTELFAEIDEAEQALKTARDALEVHRMAVEKSIFEGGFALPHQDASTEFADVDDLLAEVACSAQKRKSKRPSAPLAGDLPPLPEGWRWARLEQLICEGPANGYSPKASQDATGTFSLKLTATSGGTMRLDPDCTKVLNEKIEPGSPLFLKEGDVLFQRGNTPELVGIAAMFNGPPDTYVYPDLMIRVRTATPLLSQWLWRWANSPRGRAHMIRSAQGAAGSMPKISGETVRNMPVPVGPAHQMTSALSLLDAGCSAELSLEMEGAWAATGTLRQSILSAAFHGNLAA